MDRGRRQGGDATEIAAARQQQLVTYPYRRFVIDGGLIVRPAKALPLAADYVDRIPQGAKPADLPVQAPTKYELVINLKTAKALGLTMPDKLLVAADEVIE